MIPARDRKLRLTIYNTQANMEADTNGTVIESGIYESSARLEHTFFTALPGWGEANASMFTCELADAPDLAGKYIRVRVLGYATEAATSRTTYRVFAGKIDSCRYDKYKASRTLEAYDRLYELRKVDISEWWNTWVQTLTADTVTLPSVLAAMCTQYGVTNSASLPAYSTGTAPLKARKLGACSFVQMLGYIGEICGGYFSMQDGPLRFVDMRNVNGATAQESVEGNLDTELTEIADGDTGIYTQVTIYEGSDIVYSQGSGKNLAIADNPFLVGQTPATINSWGANIYTNATRMSGWPATLALVYSQPQSAWSRITSSSPFILTTTDEGRTRRHIVSGYSFSGPGLIDETISCTGEMREGASYSAAQNAMLSELTDLGTQLTFKVNADAVIEAVNLEAQGGVQINAEALNINGVQSTGGKLKVGVNGDVEVDGKITSQEGTIGGWTINETNIASSGNAVVLNSAGTINVTETGTTAEGAKFIAEASTDKAYYSAWGVRVENPPNMGTGNGTKALLQETGLVSETTASGGVFHGVALTDVSRNPVLTLIDRSSSEEWKNQQTEQDIKITHTDKSVSPNVVDKTMQLDKNGLYQANKDGTKDYTAEITPHASTSGGYVSRTRVSASDSSTSSSSYISDTAQTDNSATIAAHAQKTEGNNVTWSSDSAIETTNMSARINLQGYQGASATLGAYNNLGNAGGSGYETSSLSLETGSTAVTSRNDWATAALSVTRANNSGSSKLSLRSRLSGTTHTTEITPQTLKVDSHDLLRMTPHFAQMFATAIPANANLNTTTYLGGGQFYCSSNATAQSLSNCPTIYAFNMKVENAVNTQYSSSDSIIYRVRTITDILGEQYTQYVIKESTQTTPTYGAWQKIITGADSITELSSTGNITTSTAWAYTGKTITIPTAGWWAIDGYANYANAAPTAIAINREVGSYYYEVAYAERHGVYDRTVQYLYTSCVGYFDANSVIKLFAKYQTASTNGVGIRAKKLH